MFQKHCESLIVPHNLTKKFQPREISVNKTAKAFIQNQYNDWFSNKVSVQLKKGTDPADIKITSKLSNLKLYTHLGSLICINICRTTKK